MSDESATNQSAMAEHGVNQNDESKTTVGLYARVSTDDQDVDRQISEAKQYALGRYDDPEIRLYPDVISGVDEGRGDEYEQMWQAIADGELDVVVVHELSRISRLGASAIHELLEHALDHDCSVKDLEVGLEINLDDSPVTNAVKQMIAGIMGDLARVEHKQKLRRINSGISAAQEAGKWTSRPPRGFEIDEDGYLRVDTAEFLAIRRGLERVLSGGSVSDVADDIGLPPSTLRHLRDNRRDLYFRAEADDDRVDEALDDVRPLEEPDVDEGEVSELKDRIGKLERIVEEQVARGVDAAEPERPCPHCDADEFDSRDDWEEHVLSCG